MKLTALPFYFLVSHVAERLLKSARLKRGFSEQELREFGYRHNLDKLDAKRLEGAMTNPKW